MERFPTAEPLDMQCSATHGAIRAGSEAAEPVTVLVVDDYQDCREMYAAYLTLAGFHVLKAVDGLDALTVARRAVPDLIVMDLGLPVLDGCETTRRLKRDPVTRDIPVVALTAQCLPAGETLKSIGFESVIIKPCRPDDLVDEISRLLGAAPQPV